MKKRILVAEDESVIALDIKRILEKEGFEITSVTKSALDVIEHADKTKPDVILMDIMLGGALDGIEAAKIITYKHHIPIIFVTALRDEKTIKRMKLPVVTRYVTKPYRDEDLIGVINGVLESVSAN